MKKNAITFICLLILTIGNISCRKKIKINEEKIYSRHLQTYIPLTIISTPLNDDKKNIHLLLINDGQDIDQLRLKETIDSMNKKELLQPVLIVAIHALDRLNTYGVADKQDYQQHGAKAEKYAAFVDDELYPYIKKKTGIRSFKTVTIAGCSLGGLSAFDIAWNHADKIDKVGVFSGSFWWRDKDATLPDYKDSVDRIVHKMVQTSRKKPHLKYWLYAGLQEEIADRDKDGIIDVVDDTKDLIKIIQAKKVCPLTDIQYTEATTGSHDYASWSKALPAFILWAVGK